ncbi:spore protease YyaC [Selenihalanaerobacter shriftii]|uniref:Putative sporulation protein YyaC n=1 Tax=Selenihalanaerobacter shriftii TaxID=142842 RepID=A0A1T4NMH3_9FIRM|nr:spore protease YyaC [Selenihalanaerobacter shriftii]SJZ80521.1 putative sporulation protein YyaC [Selenihalanaerobacter shriftii]
MGNFQAITCQGCGRQIMDLEFFNNTKTVCNRCANASSKEKRLTKKSKLNKNKLSKKENRVHIDNPLAANKLKKIIIYTLKELYSDTNQIVILCIGTDRSTGDALGPLIGSKLTRLITTNIPVFGTLDEPVHARNLQEQIELIEQEYFNPFILAIDAGLGKNSSVGSVTVKPGPLKPGSGVNKDLPPIGDMHITGLVNIGGYMEYMVLQSTRLSLVFKMAKLISRGINWSIRSVNYIN